MKNFLQFIFLVFLFSCSNSDDNTDKKDKFSTIFVPTPGTTFEWRLDDLPDDCTTEVEVVDIDAFSASSLPTFIFVSFVSCKSSKSRNP